MNYITVNYPASASVQFEGYFYDYLSKVYLSSGDMFINLPNVTAVDAFSNMPRISAACPAFSGYEYPSSLYNVDSKNILNVTITGLSGTGNADVILFNRAGYKKMSDFGYLLQLNPSNFLVNSLILSGALFQVNNFAVPSLGYYSLNDNGGGTLIWSSSSLATADQGAIIRPNNITSSQPGRWIRQFTNNSANVRMWGTVEDGVTDDQPALQRAIDYCSLSGINNLYFNSANYYLALSGLQTNSINHNKLLNSLSAWYPNYKNPYPAAGFVGGYLEVGYYPQLNYYFNLNLIGTGNTRLFSTQIPFKCYNDTLVCDLSASTCGYNGIFFLSSNLTACNISGFTLESTSLSSGNNMYANGGIIMGGYSPVQFDASYFKPSKVKTITISNNKFINCHSAIKGGQYSSLSGTSLQTLNILNNTFKYPRGADVINFRNPDNSGGTIVTLDNTAIQNLNVINNIAEGTSQLFQTTGNIAKDGFMFGSAITSLFQNNTLSSFGYESMYSNILGFSYVGPYTNITVPAVGQPLTINFKFAGSNWTPYTAAQYLCASFIPSKYYDLAGDSYGGTNTSLGIYQLQKLLVPTLSNVGMYQYEFSATFVCVSGILGTNSWYNQYLNAFGAPGLTANAHNFFEYNPTGTYGITVSGINNNLYGGGYPWRSDMGNVFLSGNNFFISTSGLGGFNLFPFEHADPTAYQILTNNNYYMYNEVPKQTNYTPTCISISTSGSQIYNNNFYLWVDSTNITTTAVNTYTPQIYNNCDEDLNPYVPANGYLPTYYNPIAMAYGTQNQHMQVYNNNFFISNPLSAQLLTLISSDNSSNTGYLTANTIYGNNVYFNNVNTAIDLRNVYSTNFNADIITYGGGRSVALSAQNIQISTNYRNTPGDGLGGTFVWVASSTAPDDGGITIKPNALPYANGRWIRQNTFANNVANVQLWGAVGDGTTDDTVAFQNAVSAAPVGATIYIPNNTYKIGTVNLTKSITLSGSGSTTVLQTSGASYTQFKLTGTGNTWNFSNFITKWTGGFTALASPSGFNVAFDSTSVTGHNLYFYNLSSYDWFNTSYTAGGSSCVVDSCNFYYTYGRAGVPHDKDNIYHPCVSILGAHSATIVKNCYWDGLIDRTFSGATSPSLSAFLKTPADGLYKTGGAYTTTQYVINNTVRNNGEEGILVERVYQSDTCTSAITGNTCYGSVFPSPFNGGYSPSIVTNRIKGILIDSNTIYNAGLGMDIIFNSGEADGSITISNNSIQNSLVGIQINNGTLNSIIKNNNILCTSNPWNSVNSIVGNTTYSTSNFRGIYVGSGSITLTGNTINIQEYIWDKTPVLVSRSTGFPYNVFTVDSSSGILSSGILRAYASGNANNYTGGIIYNYPITSIAGNNITVDPSWSNAQQAFTSGQMYALNYRDGNFTDEGCVQYFGTTTADTISAVGNTFIAPRSYDYKYHTIAPTIYSINNNISVFASLTSVNYSNLIVSDLLNATSLQVNNLSVSLGGYYTVNDSGSGVLVYSSTSTASADGGSVLIPNNITSSQPGRWIRQFTNNRANVRMWGTKEDGVTDDQPAIQKAINYCSLSGINNLYFNAKTYFLSSFDIKPTDKAGGTKPLITNQYVYEPNYLSLGYNVNTKDTVVPILNLYGSGATLSACNTSLFNGTSGYRSAIFSILENISACTIDGFTLKNDGVLCGDSPNAGISIRGNNGGSFGWGNASNYIIGRDTVTISNNTFINCHRAINSSSSTISGGGIKNLNILYNTFLYPKGSDSVSNAGGSQIMTATYDILNYNVIGNIAEGTTYVPANSPNLKPKDGFVFFGGINSRIANNTLSRMGVESLYVGPNWSSALIPSAFTVPAVSSSVSVGPITLELNTWTDIYAITSSYGFAPNNYVSAKSNDSSGDDAGIYQINTQTFNRTSSNAVSSYNMTMTRVSGIDSYPYNLFANSRTLAPGSVFTTGRNVRLSPYNRTATIGCSSIVIDNVFTLGLALSTPSIQYMAHNPCVRSDVGITYLSGNKFGGGVYPACCIDDPRSNWIIEKNDFYMYNNIPEEPTGSSVYIPLFATPSPLKTIVRNNKLHFWVDITGNTALTANVNLGTGYDPYNWYVGFGVNYAYFGWGNRVGTTASNPLTGQTYIDNTVYCSVPSLSGYIIPVAHAGNLTSLLTTSSAVNGIDPDSTIFNFVSGNNIVFGA